VNGSAFACVPPLYNNTPAKYLTHSASYFIFTAVEDVF